MDENSTNIAHYRKLLVKRLTDAFLYENDATPLDRQSLFEKFKFILDNINGFVVICNYTKGVYEYVSDGIKSHLGYDINNLTSEQLTNFVFSVIDDPHRNFMLNHFLPVVFDYFKSNSISITTEYRYTISIRIRNSSGKYLWYLIDTVVIEVDNNGAPLRTLITCTNIDLFKQDDHVYYNILRRNEDGIYEILVEGTDNNQSDDFQLTAREIEVITLISKGYTNKKIADHLFVTLNTVKTHRKNIMRKTKCKGTAELTNFAFSRGLL